MCTDDIYSLLNSEQFINSLAFDIFISFVIF